MPALLTVEFQALTERPRGWLGVPVHGLVFAALERANLALSARLHGAQVKPFRIAGVEWDDDGRVRFGLGVLADELTGVLLEAFVPGRTYGDANDTLVGECVAVTLERESSYARLYEHIANDTGGRTLRWSLLSPTTFHVSGMDLPYPTPRLLFGGLQRRWEHFSPLHFGEGFVPWVEASVSVRDFRLFPRRVHFKGVRDAAMTASVGNFELFVVRPGDMEPMAARLLATYANFAGVGYKTAYGLGHVEVGGWWTKTETLTTPTSAMAASNEKDEY